MTIFGSTVYCIVPVPYGIIPGTKYSVCCSEFGTWYSASRHAVPTPSKAEYESKKIEQRKIVAVPNLVAFYPLFGVFQGSELSISWIQTDRDDEEANTT